MRHTIRLAALAVTLSIGLSAAAQEYYPQRLVRIVLPYTPGAAADTISRVLAQHLGERWGQAVIVENKPGASGSIGTEDVINSAPDGYTMLVSGESMFSVYASDKPRYDPLKDITAVARIDMLPYAFVTRKGFPAKTWAEFVTYARDNPGKVTISSPGYGTPHHILAELLMREVGLKLFHIPYKGSAGAMEDVVGGRVDVAFSPAPVAAPLMPLGLQALAAGGDRRSPAFPDVPSFKDLGVQGLVHSDSWNTVFVPNGTPPDVINQIAAALKVVMSDPAVVAQVTKLGFYVAYATADEFEPQRREYAMRWQKILQEVRDTQH